MIFTLTNWNTLVQAANLKRTNAIGQYIVPIYPLEEATDPHLWSKCDIITFQTFLRILCGSTFTEVTDYWSQTIINEIETSLSTNPCVACEIGDVETSVRLNYVKIDFDSIPDWNDNENEPLIYETEGNAAAEAAYTEWLALNTLINADASESEVNDQVAVLNAAATTAWNFASAASTERILYLPLAPRIDPTKIKTSTPVSYLYENCYGTSELRWLWCKTQINMTILRHNCNGYLFTPDYRYETAPNGLPILRNIFSEQSMFGYGQYFPNVWGENCENTLAALQAGTDVTYTTSYHI